jgi:hypothetical protein
MNEKFINFLKENNALETFETNLRERRAEPYNDINEYVSETLEVLDPCYLIEGGFVFFNETDGDYWTNLSDKWKEFLKFNV